MTTNDERIAESVAVALREVLPDWEPTVSTMPMDDAWVSVPVDGLIPALEVLLGRFDIRHLSAITADEIDGVLVLLYHFWEGEGITLRVDLQEPERRIPTLVSFLPGADFYEREVFEMYGVTFDGHPDLRPLLLPDDWEGGPPMRRSAIEETGESGR